MAYVGFWTELRKSGYQVDKTFGHRNIRDVRCPDLVGSVDVQALEQVGIDLVPLPWSAGVCLWVQGGDSHLLHQAPDALAVDVMAFLPQPIPNPTTAIEWPLQMHLVYTPHQLQVAI